MAKIINPTAIVGEANLGTKTITANGEYFAELDGLDGYSDVNVEVPEPVIIPTKTITENGGYEASEEDAAGYASVFVDVQPNLGTKNITENGTYSARSKGLDGFSTVVVNVPPNTSDATATADDVLYGKTAYVAGGKVTGTYHKLGQFFSKTLTGLYPEDLYGATSISSCRENKQLKEVILPSTVTSIGNNTFAECNNIEKMVLNAELTSIGQNAFYWAFATNGALIVLATTPPTLENTTALIGYATPIYVPYSADHSVLTAYQTATNWSSFSSRMRELPENWDGGALS